MKRLIGLVVAAMVLCSVPALASNVKIGYVDLQKALNESVAGKAAKATISAKYAKYQQELKAREKKLTAMKDELQKQSLLLSQDARDDKQQEYQNKVRDFQRFAKDAQDDLKQKDADFTQRIIQQLVAIAQKVGKKEGYTMILEKTQSSIVYAASKIDLTNQVVKIYDAEYKKDATKK